MAKRSPTTKTYDRKLMGLALDRAGEAARERDRRKRSQLEEEALALYRQAYEADAGQVLHEIEELAR